MAGNGKAPDTDQLTAQITHLSAQKQAVADQLETVRAQRNSALDQAAELNAQLARAQRRISALEVFPQRIAELEAEIADLKKPKRKPRPKTKAKPAGVTAH